MTSTTSNGATVDNLNVLDTVTTNNTGGVELIALQDVANALFPSTNATQTQTIDGTFWASDLDLTFAGSTVGTYFTLIGSTDSSGKHFFAIAQTDRYGNTTGSTSSSLLVTATTATQFISQVVSAASLIGAGSNLSSTSLLDALDFTGGTGKNVIQATLNGQIANIFTYVSANDSFNGTGSQWDEINNFNVGVDKLDFRKLVKDPYAGANSGFLSKGLGDLIWLGQKPNNTTNLSAAGAYGVWYSTDGFVYADTNGDGNADLKIHVSGVSTLSQSDFLGVESPPTLSNVSITGTAQEGQVLTANATPNYTDDTITYQWQSGSGSSFTNISGATGSTYTAVEGDEGKKLRVVITDTGAGTTTATATTATTVIDAAPSISVSISGTAQEGQTLTAVVTGNEADDTLAYQWMSGTTVVGTGATYQVAETDEGSTITLSVTATAEDNSGSDTKTATTGTVSDITLAFNTAASISGVAKEGTLLTAVAGTLNDSDAAVTGYQWQISANGSTGWTDIGGATSSTYTPVEGDETQFLRVVETATDVDGGPATTSTSAPTSAVSDITLAFNTAASISGVAKEGTLLTAVAGTLNDSDAAVTGYQWQISANGSTGWTDIGGATSSTYTPVEGDETQFLRVVETATDVDGGPATTSTSAPTSAVSDITLAFNTAASISGVAKEGTLLTAVAGTLNDSDAAVTGYQWQISANGSTGWTDIGGATSSTYTPVEGDETQFLRVVETATDVDGGPATTSTSAPTSAVSDITLAFNTAASISGVAKEGTLLTAVAGTLNDSDAAVTGYQWQISANGSTGWTDIGGATSSTYTPVEGDETQFLRVVETATDVDGGPATTSTSAPTSAVSDITLAFNTAASISGVAKEGTLLTAVAGTLNDSDAAVTGYQWQISANGSTGWTDIGGATSSTYTPVEGDETQFLRVVETATDVDGGPATTSTSAPTSAVSDITLAFNTAASISGVAKEGTLLTAVAGTLNDSDAAVTGYQWQISANGSTGWTDIGGATSSTYTPVEGDETQFLRVVETATDVDGGPATTSTSAPTSAVSDITLAFNTAASISGVAKEGTLLTAVAGTLNDSDAAVTGYQWQISANGSTGWTDIGGATSSTYTPVEGDETQFLRVVETATDVDGGPATTSTSAPTSAVSDITLAFNTAASISGVAKEGTLLTAVAGTLNDSDAAVTGYQWQISANGSTGWTDIGGATSSTYTPVEGDETQFLRVVETATDVDGGPATTSTSAPTSAVSDITLAFNTAASISGVAKEGTLLTAVAGTLNDSDAAVTGYQWQISANGSTGWTDIGGATSSTYTPVEGDETQFLRVVETATDVDGGPATTSTSAPTSAVSDITLAFNTAASISGVAKEGTLLTAVAGTLNDSDAAVTGYQWQISANGSTGWTDIGGATSSTYTPVEGDETQFLRVVETATDVDGGPATTSTSAPTSAVSDITLAFNTAASISGVAKEGTLLTAVAGTLNDSDAAVTGYQWQISANGSTGWTDIGGATSSTYTPVEGDETQFLRVVETATDVDGGPATTSTSAPTSAVSDITLAFNTAASISGVAKEGTLLTAVAGTLNDSDAAVTGYQWQISANGSTGWTDIGGATSSTYTPVEGDETQFLRVVETATDVDGGPATTSTSAPTSAVSDITLAFNTAASISGVAKEGTLLTAVAGTLNDSDAAVTGYQWQISANGSTGWTDIGGATSSTYTPVEGDETQFLRVVETATDVDGGPATTSTSAPTSAVSDITLAFNTAASISGVAKEGTLLTAVAGTLNDSDAAVTGYQWQISANGSTGWTDIGGATSSTYTPVEGDETQFLRVVETATDVDGGPATTSTSAPTSAVSDITLAFNTAASISGVAKEGTLLTAVAGTLNDSDAAVTGYQWQISANGSTGWTDIGGATSSTYTPVEGDETQFLRVVETATDVDGGPATTSTSAPTSAVSDITLAFNTAASISGVAKEGTLLTAVAGTLNDSDAAVTGYQWQISANGSTGWTDIGGATSSTYTPVEGDETQFLRVVETATDVDGGPATTSTSAPTSAVSDITLAFNTAASISGVAKEGTLLTAVAGTLNDSDAAVTGYQWQISANGSTGWTDIGGATSSTYTPVEGDETQFLRVVETATDVDGGPATTSTSAPTSAVSDITLAFNTAASISGVAKEGTLLTAVAGTLNDSDAAVTGYQWQISANGSTGWTDIGGATSSTYTPVEGDETQFLRVVETATDVDGGPATTSTSAPTSAVSDITLAFNTAASISGVAKEGTLLTAVAGTLNDSDAAVTGYQWQISANGSTGWTDIGGATSSTYTPVEGDETQFLRVVETATDVDGGPATTSTSAPTSAVSDITLKPTVTAGPNTGANGSGNSTATFVVTFEEPVTGVTTGTWNNNNNKYSAGQFTLFGTATTGFISAVSGSGASYTVTVNYTHNGNGSDLGHSLGLNFVNTSNLIHDSETGESSNLAVATNIITAQFSSLLPAGVSGEPINLGLSDPSSDHAGTVTIAGVPSGWSLNEGTNNGDGSWTVQTSNITALSITSPVDYTGALVLNVAESWTNVDGSSGNALVADNIEVYAKGAPIFAWSGDDTLTASSGDDLVVFSQPIGNDTIYNFDTAHDKIDLIGYSEFTSFADVQAHLANDADGNATITLANGQAITLSGIDAGALSGSDFVFDQTPVTNNAGSMTISDGAVLPLDGIINNTGTIALNSTGDETDLQLIQHGITLEGGGQVNLSDSSENVITGTAPDVTLTNVDNTISGAGQLGEGQMILFNEGTINATGTNALVVDTGSNIVANSGTLEATGSGGLVVNSAVDNTGSLWASGGNITINGAVTGNGSATISGAATLEFGSASAENTTFAVGATGTLKLDESAGFTGTISGFAAGDALDLADIAFSANPTLSYSANADGTGGMLSVNDGTHIASIALLGQYAAAGFQVGSDQGTGAMVTYADPSLNDPALITNPNQSS